jgi:pimeloyl-ACP methyl ester carboxylesterase
LDHQRIFIVKKLSAIHYRNSLISWYQYGTGPRPVLCFHGYGEDAQSFGFLEKWAGNEYSFYAIELPFHGHTEWNDGLDFDSGDLLNVVDLVLQSAVDSQQSAVHSGENRDRLILIGFSLGGRIALSFLQAAPERVEKIILLAPDGLKVNFWYWLTTQTWLGNRLFKFTMYHPGWFFGFLNLLNKLRMVNASVYKFVNYYIGDQDLRIQLYNRWTSLRKLRPNLSKIKRLIRQNDTPVRLVYGRHDRIILSSVGEKFRKGIEQQAILRVIESGHQVLHEKHAKEIIAVLLN